MALDNLISVKFTAAELLQLDGHITGIKTLLTGKLVNLSPQQRQQHARVKYEMEVWVQKAYNYLLANPALVPAFIDTVETTDDITTHNQLNPRIDQLEVILQGLIDTNLLLGTDLYNNLMAFYRSLKAASSSNAPGAAAIYADLKQQFPGPKGKHVTP